MADISVTAASVKAVGATTAGTPLRVQQVVYGASVTQGQPLYSDATASNKYKPADADVLASSVAVGVALTPGGDGDTGFILVAGKLNVGGAVLTTGTPYYVSTNAGGIAPVADIGSGDFVTILGVASSTSVLDVDIVATQIAKA